MTDWFVSASQVTGPALQASRFCHQLLDARGRLTVDCNVIRPSGESAGKRLAPPGRTAATKDGEVARSQQLEPIDLPQQAVQRLADGQGLCNRYLGKGIQRLCPEAGFAKETQIAGSNSWRIFTNLEAAEGAAEGAFSNEMYDLGFSLSLMAHSCLF